MGRHNSHKYIFLADLKLESIWTIEEKKIVISFTDEKSSFDDFFLMSETGENI